MNRYAFTSLLKGATYTSLKVSSQTLKINKGTLPAREKTLKPIHSFGRKYLP